MRYTLLYVLAAGVWFSTLFEGCDRNPVENVTYDTTYVIHHDTVSVFDTIFIMDTGTATSVPSGQTVLSLHQLTITDLSFLRHATGLKWLDIASCRSLVDLSAVSDLKELSYFHMYYSEVLTDISPLGSLPKLVRLELENLYKVSDISALTKLHSLDYVKCTSCKLLKDFTPLLECLDAGDTAILTGDNVPDSIKVLLEAKGVVTK